MKDIFTNIYDVNDEVQEHIYTNQTGDFPLRSIRGNQYLMVIVGGLAQTLPFLIFTHAHFFVQTLFIYVIENCLLFLFKKKPLARENER